MAQINKNTIGQFWCAKIYDDSSHPNWRDLLDVQSGSVISIVSPLHNKDLISKGKNFGDTVKPHRHVVFDYGSNVSYSRVKADCDNLQFDLSPDANICKIAEKRLPRALTYLCHLTRDSISKGKQIYDSNDLEFFGDFDLNDWNRYYQAYCDSVNDDFNYFIDIIQYINKNSMIFYNDLIDMCISDKNFEWLRYLHKSGHSQVISAYMRSMEYKSKIQISK